MSKGAMWARFLRQYVRFLAITSLVLFAAVPTRVRADAPNAADDSAEGQEDVPLIIDVLLNDTDPDQDDLTIMDKSDGEHGIVTIIENGTRLSYSPALNYWGTDWFTYTVDDGTGGTDWATVRVTVTSVIEAPTLQDLPDMELDEDTHLDNAVDLCAYVIDDDTPCSSLTFAITNSPNPQAGVSIESSRYVDIVPAENWFGATDVRIKVIDLDGETDTDTFSVIVRSVNDPPTAAADEAEVGEDKGPINIYVRSNDTWEPDPYETLTIVGVAKANLGIAARSEGHTYLIYRPNENAYGTDVFTYTIRDGNGGVAIGVVTVTIEPENDEPSVQDDVEDGVEDTTEPIIIAVLDNDSDIEGELNHASVQVLLGPSNGATETNSSTGEITYTPDPDWSGTDGFVYQVCDVGWPLPPKCGDALVTVTIEERNDPPVADAGEDRVAYLRDRVTLDGSGSYDPDGNLPLEYVWRQVFAPGDPAIGLDMSDPEHPTFEVPFEPGTKRLTFELMVIDSDLERKPSLWDQVVITATNRPPVVDAGADQNVDANASVTLDGSGSYDMDDPQQEHEMQYVWDQTEGPRVQLSDWEVMSPHFTAPLTPTLLAFRLMVFDYHGLAAYPPFDEVQIVVGNNPPVPVAGEDQRVYANALVMLDGSGSYDRDSQLELTYTWSQIDGPPVQLSHSEVATPTFTAPNLPGTLTFALSVKDAFDLPSEPLTDTVTITIPPFVYLPQVTRYYCPEGGNCGPDLVVQSLRVKEQDIEVVIANQGSETVNTPFWVDAYINPSPVPPTIYDPYWDLGSQGIMWKIAAPEFRELRPGDWLVLNRSNWYAPYSNVDWQVVQEKSTQVYAVVDVHENGGKVPEMNEQNNCIGPESCCQ